MWKRIFDILFSTVGLVLLSPFLVLIAVLIPLGSRGGIFYIQVRIGKDGKPFSLYKFRTMYPASDKKGLLTVGKDDRVTPIGRYLRAYKADEFPQLWNILKGDMSLVGPRPEVEKYVRLYSDEQRKVLNVKPGLTDLASLAFMDENEMLGKSDDPEKTYIQEIMPQKLALNQQYIHQMSLRTDFKIILKTIRRILVRK